MVRILTFVNFIETYRFLDLVSYKARAGPSYIIFLQSGKRKSLAEFCNCEIFVRLLLVFNIIENKNVNLNKDILHALVMG